MFDMQRGHLVIAADRRSLRSALGNFSQRDLSDLLAEFLAERFGRNRAETILQNALKEVSK